MQAAVHDLGCLVSREGREEASGLGAMKSGRQGSGFLGGDAGENDIPQEEAVTPDEGKLGGAALSVGGETASSSGGKADLDFGVLEELVDREKGVREARGAAHVAYE